MEYDGYFLLGRIVRTHGVKGNVLVKLDVDDPSRYKKLKKVFLDQGSALKEYEISSTSLNGDIINFHLNGIEDMDIAETLIYKELFLPVSELPGLKDNKLYLHEAPGLLVVDHQLGELGVIEKVFELPEQAVAMFRFKEKEVLFPLISAFIEKIDRDKKILHTRLPEGLLDIYIG